MCAHLARFSSCFSFAAFFSSFGRFLLFAAFAALFLRAFGHGWGRARSLPGLSSHALQRQAGKKERTWVSCWPLSASKT